MNSTRWLLAFDVALLAMAVWMGAQGRWIPAISLFVALALFALWQNVLYSALPNTTQVLRIEPFFHPTHYVQAALHSTMYAYLGLYWGVVGDYVPLLIAQIIVGYQFDMLLSWSRRRVWRAGFGVVPIILSTNLFMWFLDQYFYLQLGLIALAFLGKEFITWDRDGRRRHIFNPSAFALSVVSLCLLATNAVGMTRGVEIAAAFEMPPSFFEVIFLLSLVVQALFITTPVTFGTAASLFVLFGAAKLIVGQPLVISPIHPAVFLGMSFLVTDPATSPRSHLGRFIFGIAYGTGVFISFIILRSISEPAFFDKLLVVPIVNLLVPWIDQMCGWIEVRLKLRPLPTYIPRFGWLLAYIALFNAILPTLKYSKLLSADAEQRVRATPLFPPPKAPVTPEFAQTFSNHLEGRKAVPAAYRPWGYKAEIENLSLLRGIYKNGRETAAIQP